eukprot:5630454-Pyramimonas_sp.AAC.1
MFLRLLKYCCTASNVPKVKSIAAPLPVTNDQSAARAASPGYLTLPLSRLCPVRAQSVLAPKRFALYGFTTMASRPGPTPMYLHGTSIAPISSSTCSMYDLHREPMV